MANIEPPELVEHRYAIVDNDEDFIPQRHPSFIRNGSLGSFDFTEPQSIMVLTASQPVKPSPFRAMRHKVNEAFKIPYKKRMERRRDNSNQQGGASQDSHKQPITFLTLPREVRDQIYSELVGFRKMKPQMFWPKNEIGYIQETPEPTQFQDIQTSILLANKQIHQEAALVLYQSNMWISVQMVSYNLTQTLSSGAWKERFRQIVGRTYEITLDTAAKNEMALVLHLVICEGVIKNEEDSARVMELAAAESEHVDGEHFLIPADASPDLFRAIVDLSRDESLHSKAFIQSNMFLSCDYLPNPGTRFKAGIEILRGFLRIRGIYKHFPIPDVLEDLLQDVSLEPFSSAGEAASELQTLLGRARMLFDNGQWTEAISAYTTAHVRFEDVWTMCEASALHWKSNQMSVLTKQSHFYILLTILGECNICRSWAALHLANYQAAFFWAERAFRTPSLGSLHLLKCHTARSLASAGLGYVRRARVDFDSMHRSMQELQPTGTLPALEAFLKKGKLNFDAEFGSALNKNSKERRRLRHRRLDRFRTAWNMLWQPLIDYKADPRKRTNPKMAGPYGKWDSVPWFVPVEVARPGAFGFRAHKFMVGFTEYDGQRKWQFVHQGLLQHYKSRMTELVFYSPNV